MRMRNVLRETHGNPTVEAPTAPSADGAEAGTLGALKNFWGLQKRLGSAAVTPMPPLADVTPKSAARVSTASTPGSGSDAAGLTPSPRGSGVLGSAHSSHHHPHHPHVQAHGAKGTPIRAGSAVKMQPFVTPPKGGMTPRVVGSSSAASTASSAGGATDCATTVATPLTPSVASLTPTPSAWRYLLREVQAHERKPTLTVVLDLDETLVSNRRADLPAAILRPYVLHVLNAMRQMPGVEIVLWTASTRETGGPVVDQLHEGGHVFDEVIFRNDRWFTEPIHTKDLRLLGRDMDRVLVCDNSPNCVKLNPRNAVLCEDFVGARESSDGALVNLYYVVEALVRFCAGGRSVGDGLAQLQQEGHLCRPVFFMLPDAWAGANLRDIAPLRVPPHGKYTRLHTAPPPAETMRHWTF